MPVPTTVLEPGSGVIFPVPLHRAFNRYKSDLQRFFRCLGVIYSTDLVKQVPVLLNSDNGNHRFAEGLYNEMLSSEFGLLQDVPGVGAK
jgi:hypothetical protein